MQKLTHKFIKGLEQEAGGFWTGQRVAIVEGEHIGRWGYVAGYPGDGCVIRVILAGVKREEITTEARCLAAIKGSN